MLLVEDNVTYSFLGYTEHPVFGLEIKADRFWDVWGSSNFNKDKKESVFARISGRSSSFARRSEIFRQLEELQQDLRELDERSLSFPSESILFCSFVKKLLS